MAIQSPRFRRNTTRQPRSGWKDALLYSGVLAAMIGAAPQALQVYRGYRMGVPISQVQIATHEANLWERSGGCLLNTRTIHLAEDLSVTVGACGETGDIQVRVSNGKGKEMVRWIESIRDPEQNAIANFLIGTAHAQTPLPAPVALAANEGADGVICTRKIGKSRIIQRIRENGRCFDLLIDIFTGQVISRTAVACTPECPGG